MKRFGPLMIILLASLASAFSQTTTNTLSANFSRAEQAAWNQEEAYWRYLKTKDYDSYLKLWDERFAGWPAPLPAPAHKEDLRKLNNRNVVDYKIEPLSVRQYGSSIVITFYRATYRSIPKGGGEEMIVSRLTHTWMKEKGGWHIIGGMSSRESGLAR